MTEQAVYSDEEWGLLVGLPQAVIVAASASEPDGTRKTMAEAAAGLEAIAAGRDSGSPLVEQVALHVVEQVGDPEEGAEAPLIRPDDIDAEIADVLDRARAATALLTGKAGDGEAAAYKFWLVGIAEAVITAASTGGVLGIGGEWVSESERRFIDELADVLES
ncbi:hypothetical protein GCM10009682_63960 [Luedemannella flava]|uniref:Uncharacterized protein n=1 Tax=Luedemannella flava TaxID=349316 RepID=A0ABP4Z311_9ACTN